MTRTARSDRITDRKKTNHPLLDIHAAEYNFFEVGPKNRENFSLLYRVDAVYWKEKDSRKWHYYAERTSVATTGWANGVTACSVPSASLPFLPFFLFLPFTNILGYRSMASGSSFIPVQNPR